MLSLLNSHFAGTVGQSEGAQSKRSKQDQKQEEKGPSQRPIIRS